MAEPNLPTKSQSYIDEALFPPSDDKKKKTKKKKPTAKKGKAASKLDKPKNNPIADFFKLFTDRGPRTKNVSNVETTEPPAINRGPRSNSSDNKISSTEFLAGMDNSFVGEGGSPKLNFSDPPKSIKPLTDPADFMRKNILAKKTALEKYKDIGNLIKDEAAGAREVTEEMRDRFNKAKESYNRNKLTREEKAFDQQERMKREKTPTLFNYTSKDLREMDNPPIEIDDKGEIKRRPFNPAEKLIRQREERLKKIREYKKAVRERNKFDPDKKDSRGKTRQQRYDDLFGGRPFGQGTILSQYSGDSNLKKRMNDKIKENERRREEEAKKNRNLNKDRND